ncbi:polynucleotide adenylyltransferase PcnB [Chromatium okenii]|uniref:polynucleotide adenylyltransferase PcnB n=1 Tax=Chromatium okenii TaxID=61644 RepID=UPI0026F1FDD2|nr:polynucleotide adenylyltransferase PcnB [Chromatium okenii]MBV5308363.1 polynucleotide adenylyltransferase PcnB [Chromatium okenii]
MQESDSTLTGTTQPVILPRPQHNISRTHISDNALKVLYRLRQENFQAHLVGGGVRDLLLGHEPKDFDIATDATPEQVRQVFRNCRLIGRRFRLAHVHFGHDIIEVATFRGCGDATDQRNRQLTNGMIVRDNIYGTIEEDALRRDFTINALYYDISDFSVLDYAGGIADLQRGVLRLIGDPEQRYREDPVRMLRAVRFACKLGFTIDPPTERPLFALGALLADISPARLFDELIKLFESGYGLEVFEKLRHYQLFQQLFPDTEECLAHEEHEFPLTFVSRGLASTDQRIHANKPVATAFLLAILLWEPVRQRAEQLQANGLAPLDAMLLASHTVCQRQQHLTAIPKRFSLPMREIWLMQSRLEQRDSKRLSRLLTHPRFRAAYDFLLLRAEAGEVDAELGQWWTRFQSASIQERVKMLDSNAKRRRSTRRRSKSPAPLTTAH